MGPGVSPVSVEFVSNLPVVDIVGVWRAVESNLICVALGCPRSNCAPVVTESIDTKHVFVIDIAVRISDPGGRFLRAARAEIHDNGCLDTQFLHEDHVFVETVTVSLREAGEPGDALGTLVDRADPIDEVVRRTYRSAWEAEDSHTYISCSSEHTGNRRAKITIPRGGSAGVVAVVGTKEGRVDRRKWRIDAHMQGWMYRLGCADQEQGAR